MQTDKRYNNTEYLVERFLDDIVRMSFVYVKNLDDAQDIASSVFVTYLQKKPEFLNEEHAKNWLFKVAVNLSKNYLRSKRPILSFDELEGIFSTYDTDYTYNTDSDEQVLNAVLRLKRPYREVIHLYYYEGYDTKEIAKMLSIPPATVRSRLARARDAIEKTLKGGNVYEGLQKSNGQN